MSNNVRHSLAVLSLVALAGAGTPVQAATLPNGAETLSETYRDWAVVCQTRNDATTCIMRQSQSNTQTRQHVLTVEFQRNAEGKLLGALLMPFGLTLGQGVAMQVDDTDSEPALGFTSCLPAGCLVPFSADNTLITKLRAGSTLKLLAHAHPTGQPVTLKVSLKGFSAALKRINELTG